MSAVEMKWPQGATHIRIKTLADGKVVTVSKAESVFHLSGMDTKDLEIHFLAKKSGAMKGSGTYMPFGGGPLIVPASAPKAPEIPVVPKHEPKATEEPKKKLMNKKHTAKRPKQTERARQPRERKVGRCSLAESLVIKGKLTAHQIAEVLVKELPNKKRSREDDYIKALALVRATPQHLKARGVKGVNYFSEIQHRKVTGAKPVRKKNKAVTAVEKADTETASVVETPVVETATTAIEVVAETVVTPELVTEQAAHVQAEPEQQAAVETETEPQPA